MHDYNRKHLSPVPRRRQFLRWLWSLPLAAVALQLIQMLSAFSLPKSKPDSFGTIIDLGPVADLPGIAENPIHFSRGKFWLVQSEDGLLAIANTCTHLSCLFSWNQAERRFICPCHGSQFDRAGMVLTGPASRSLDRYPLLLVDKDGSVVARTDPPGSPLKLPLVATGGPAADVETTGATTPEAGLRLQVDTRRKIAGLPSVNMNGKVLCLTEIFNSSH